LKRAAFGPPSLAFRTQGLVLRQGAVPVTPRCL